MVEYKYNKRDKVIVAIDDRTYADYFIVNRFNLNCVNYYEVTRTLERADTGEIIVEVKVVSEDKILKKKVEEETVFPKKLLKLGALVVDASGFVYQYIPLKDFDFSYYENIWSESLIAKTREEGVFLNAYNEFMRVEEYDYDLRMKDREYEYYDIDEIYYPKKFWHIGGKAIMDFMNSVSEEEDWTLVWKRKPAVSRERTVWAKK
jgi:hypothetical protein